MNNVTRFYDMKKEILACKICKEHFGFEPHPIVLGSMNSKIMQISQAPSYQVHISMKPFNDLSGRKLKREWYDISDEDFYNPSNFYITALGHCFPGKLNGGGDKLPPKICADTWLNQEIELVENKLYILIGRYAANYFYPKSNYKDLIFKDNRLNGKPALVLPHPSPLNIKWFKDNPKFLEERIIQIREIVHSYIK